MKKPHFLVIIMYVESAFLLAGFYIQFMICEQPFYENFSSNSCKDSYFIISLVLLGIGFSLMSFLMFMIVKISKKTQIISDNSEEKREKTVLR